MKSAAKIAAAAWFVAAAMPALAVNKCTDPKTGAVSYSDSPCGVAEKGARVVATVRPSGPPSQARSYVAAAAPIGPAKTADDFNREIREAELKRNPPAPEKPLPPQREPRPDQLKVHRYAAELLDVYRVWVDAERLAQATPRVALATPVGAIQQLRRNTESMQLLPCLQASRAALLALVGANETAMLAFMARDEMPALAYKLVLRPQWVAEFESRIQRTGC